MLVSWLPFVYYFLIKGALRDFYFWQTTASFRYVVEGHSGMSNLAIFWRQIKVVLSENGLLWLMAIVGIVWAWKHYREPGATDPEVKDRPWQQTAWILMATWPLFSFFGVAVGGRFFAHYFIQIIPPLSVLGGVGLARVIDELRTRRFGYFRRPQGFVMAVAILLFIYTDAAYYLRYNGIQISLHQYKTPLFSVTRFIGEHLRERTEPDDFIYVWAVNPEINFYALRKTPSPYLMHVSLGNLPWDAYEEIMQSLHRASPKYIVEMQGTSGFPALQEYIRKNYTTETNPDLNKLKKLVPFQIFRRKDT
jgi:hypothetical protein